MRLLNPPGRGWAAVAPTVRKNRGEVFPRGIQHGFGIEIYHHPDDRLSDEDVVFYALLTRGMAYSATQDVQSLLEMGEESYGDENDIVLTQH